MRGFSGLWSLFALAVEHQPFSSKHVELQETPRGALVFELEDIAYMANARYSEVTVRLGRELPGSKFHPR